METLLFEHDTFRGEQIRLGCAVEAREDGKHRDAASGSHRGAGEDRAGRWNVPETAAWRSVIGFLPAEKEARPLGRLADTGWVAVEVILEEKLERELIPRLKRAGATGIITYPLNKVIP